MGNDYDRIKWARIELFSTEIITDSACDMGLNRSESP